MMLGTTPAAAQTVRGLVIGIDAYDELHDLAGAVNDVRDVAGALAGAGVDGRRQDAGDRRQRPVEGQFAKRRVAGHVLDRQDAHRHQQAERDGRSKWLPSLARSAGARLTVIRLAGSANPSAPSAARTRSRDSATALSGSPTTVNEDSPEAICTWVSTSITSMP